MANATDRTTGLRLIGFVGIPLGILLGCLLGSEFAVAGLLLAGGICFVALAFRCPLGALFLYMLVSPVLSTLSVSLGEGVPDLTFYRLGLLAVLCGFVWRRYWMRGSVPRIRLTGVELWMIVFCAVTSVFVFVNAEAGTVVSSMLSFVDTVPVPFVVFFLARNLLVDGRSRDRFLWVLICMAVYLGVMGVFEHLTLIDVLPASYPADIPREYTGLRIGSSHDIPRANGPFTYPETFGVVCAMVLVMLSYYASTSPAAAPRSAFVRSLLAAGIFFSLSGVFSCMYRTIWIGAAGGVVVRFGMLRRYRKRVLGLVLLSAVAAWWAWGLLADTELFRQRVGVTGSIYTRFATYQVGWRTFLETPFRGLGFGNFHLAVENYPYASRVAGEAPVLASHNAYLALLVEEGVLGFAAYLSILVVLLLCALRLYRQAPARPGRHLAAAAAGLLAIYTATSFGDNIMGFADVNMLFFFLMGMVVARAQEALAVRPAPGDTTDGI